MVERAATARTEAVQAFAAVLQDLRTAAGTPSFRELAARSQAISHTTLHEAAQGHRLPTWATTVEFVKACGRDPEEFREQWERADATIRGESLDPLEESSVETPTDPEPTSDGVVVDAPPPAADGPAPRRRHRALLLAGGGVVLVAAAAVVTAVVVSSGDDGRGVPAATPTVLTAADCPVKQTNPPPEPPATAGDHGKFVIDVTLPDCSPVARGATVTKTWRFRNIGTVPWVGYSLHRVDLPQQRDQCQTITDVPVADTRPGATVDVSTAVTAPRQATFCFVRFRFQDASGHDAFPGGRPVNFQLVVS